MTTPDVADTVRLDKWLWAARFFKTRGLAAEAVTGGKVQVNGTRTKPAKPVRIGDRLTIRRGMYAWTVIVEALATVRRPAPEAVRLYEETPESARDRERVAKELRADTIVSEGRPSKKGRRDLLRFTRDRDSGA